MGLITMTKKTSAVAALVGKFAILLAGLLFLLTLATAAGAQQTRVSVGFEEGYIGEYNNQAHAPTHAQTFATLGITSVTISQLTDNGYASCCASTDVPTRNRPLSWLPWWINRILPFGYSAENTAPI